MDIDTHIPPDEDEAYRRSRSPSYKLASPRWSTARLRNLEVHAEKLRERLECISPPRWKSREQLYAEAVAEPYDKAGVRMSPITPTPPSLLSPSPGPSPYQPAMYSRLSSMSPRSLQSISPPTTRSMSLDDNSSSTSLEDALHNITKLATTQSPRQMSFSPSTSPGPELSRGCGEDEHVSVYQKPVRRKVNANARRARRSTSESKYRIEKIPSRHPMITRSRRREGIR